MTSNGRATRIPLEHSARVINERAGLYLSEAQQRGLALGLFVGAIAGFAAASWAVSRAVQQYVR